MISKTIGFRGTLFSDEPILSIHDTFSTEISPFPVETTGFQRQYRFMSWSLMAVTSWVQLASWRHGMGRMIYLSIYLSIFVYMHMYIYINNSLGGWRLPEMHGVPCGTAICGVVSVIFRACFSNTRSMQHIVFTCLPKTVPKLPFEAYLKDILVICSVSSR